MFANITPKQVQKRPHRFSGPGGSAVPKVQRSGWVQRARVVQRSGWFSGPGGSGQLNANPSAGIKVTALIDGPAPVFRKCKKVLINLGIAIGIAIAFVFLFFHRGLAPPHVNNKRKTKAMAMRIPMQIRRGLWPPSV